MKIVIADKDGKTYQTEVEKGKESSLYGMKIDDSFDGGMVAAAGYKLQITGGSDKDGTPMRKDITGVRRTDVLLSDGPGFRPQQKGDRSRKKVRGNAVAEDIAQLNVKVLEAGSQKLVEIFPKASGEKKDEKK